MQHAVRSLPDGVFFFYSLWYGAPTMSVRMRHTRSHTNNRRSHHALKGTVIVKDKESGALRLPHRLDEATGMYRGKQIVPKKEVQAEAKDHEKRLAEHKHEDASGDKEPVVAKKQTKTEKEA